MNRFLLTVATIFSFVFLGFTQNNSDFEITEYYYANNIKSYKKILKKDSTNNEVRNQLAFAYSKIGSTNESYAEYQKLIKTGFKNFSIDDWNNIAQYSLANENYELADQAFEQLKNSSNFNNSRKLIIPGYFEVYDRINLNTQYSEFCPTFFEEDLIFISDRPTTAYDLNKSDWTSTPYLSGFVKDTSKQNGIKALDKVFNKSGHLGTIFFTKDGNTAFYTRAYPEMKNGLNTAQLIIAHKIDGKWKDHEIFMHGTDRNYSYAHPVYLESLSMLIFSSNMTGGIGNMDLYYSIYENGQWSSPINLGNKINTQFNEVFPSVDPVEENCIYFSSNGHAGFGGLDVYKTTFRNGLWSDPVLLPRAINSGYDDFGILFIDENHGYISSNRNGGAGRDDIYSFTRKDLIKIEGYLVDEFKHEPLPLQKLYIVDQNNKVIDSIISNKEGYFIYDRLPYQNISLMPPSEAGVNMTIKTLDEDLIKDQFVNIHLLSSNGYPNDSISLIQPTIITYVIETDKQKSRCVVYENGDKAVYIRFNVKDSLGNIIDQITSDRTGCFKFEKLYPSGSILAFDEELQNSLKLRFLNPEDEKNTDWQEDLNYIEITSQQRCVEFEDGSKAVRILFAVKDSLGNILDHIITDENGCFNIRKLYQQPTHLELMEEELAAMGMRIMSPHDSDDIEWFQKDDKIILKLAEKCLIYKDGGHPANSKYVIKNSEETIIEGSITDENGCLKLRKLYDEDDYTIYVLDESGLTHKAKMDQKTYGYLILEPTEMELSDFDDITITVRRCVEYEDGTKAVKINFAVIDNSLNVIDRFTTDQEGCFSIQKLYGNSQLRIEEEELTSLGMRFKDPEEGKNEWYKVSDKIILVMGERCLTYENGKKISNQKYAIKDKDGNTIESSIMDNNGCLKMKKLYDNEDYYIELIKDNGMVIKMPLLDTNEVTLIGRIFDYHQLNNSYTGLKVVLYDDNGKIAKVSLVNEFGTFTFQKLEDDQNLKIGLIDEIGLLTQIKKIKIEGTVINSEKLVDTHSKAISVQVKDKNGTDIIDQDGHYSVDINLQSEAIITSNSSNVVFNNIYFDFGKYTLNNNSKKVLDQLAEELKANPKLFIVVKAHTDSRGSAEINLKLSQKRAEAVANYLISRGVSMDRFDTKGLGETELINKCKDGVWCSEEEHAKNRRIEFEFIQK